MGVPCPGCGRQYDITLFSFGRTIHCTCGTRVAADLPRTRELPAGDARFIADAMLGHLARWLRIAGFDVAYEAHLPDEEVVRRALEQGRIILTRDRGIPVEWTAPAVYLVGAEHTLDQLAEVLARFELVDAVRPFSRCSLCNEPLMVVDARAARAAVPEGVRRAGSDFRRCPACNRLYWRGSHTEDMERSLEEACNRARADLRRARSPSADSSANGRG